MAEHDNQRKADAIRGLGWPEYDGTYDYRLNLIATCLRHKSHLVREAAGLALADMGDYRVLDTLKWAVKCEKRSKTKANLQLAVAMLEKS